MKTDKEFTIYLIIAIVLSVLLTMEMFLIYGQHHIQYHYVCSCYSEILNDTIIPYPILFS